MYRKISEIRRKKFIENPVRINVVLPGALHKRLKRRAESCETSINEFIRVSIESALDVERAPQCDCGAVAAQENTQKLSLKKW